jgi:hypothetical protein
MSEKFVSKAVDDNGDGLDVYTVVQVGRTCEYMDWLIEASSLSPLPVG